VFSNLLPGNDSFVLSVVTGTSVYLAFAHQRTSGSGSTIPPFRRHVTISLYSKNVTEQADSVGNAPDLYLGGTRFESLSEYRFSDRRAFSGIP
jgi:hypothetical protein